MRIKREQLVLTNASLVWFGGTRVYPLSVVTLPVIVGDYIQQITKDVTFLIVNYLSTYNTILGQSTLNSWGPSGSTRVLYSKARNGQPFTNHEHRRTMDGCRAYRGIGRDTP